MPKPERDSRKTVEEPLSEYRLEDGTILAPPEPHVIKEIPREFLDRYELLRPIPIKFEHEEPESCVAVFKEANISMTGYSKSNARDELAYTIMDFLEVFRDDPDFTQGCENRPLLYKRTACYREMMLKKLPGKSMLNA